MHSPILAPVVALVAAVLARRHGVAVARRPLFVAGLGGVGALEAHGLTDQVVTTNVGTGMRASVLIHLPSLVLTKQIGRVLVDPKNPNIVFVAALGNAYSSSPDRGVYRSRDGGATWQKVLFKNDDVGAIDLNFDPANSQIVYATLWNVRRPPGRRRRPPSRR